METGSMNTEEGIPVPSESTVPPVPSITRTPTKVAKAAPIKSKSSANTSASASASANAVTNKNPSSASLSPSHTMTVKASANASGAASPSAASAVIAGSGSPPQKQKNTHSTSHSHSPAPSLSSYSTATSNRPPFTIPTLPEYNNTSSSTATGNGITTAVVAGNSTSTSGNAAGTTMNSNMNANNAGNEGGGGSGPAMSSDDSTTNSQAVLLGIQTLERQQAELERKRQRHHQRNNNNLNTGSSHNNSISTGTGMNSSSMNNIRNIRRANPFETTPMEMGMGMRGPQDHDVPMTVHVTGEADDELTMTSDLKGMSQTGTASSAVQGRAAPSTGKKVGGRNRINSISKLLKTPLKPIKRSISDRFNIDPTPTRQVHEDDQDVEPIIFGYLHKLGRNNKWQNRWFESDGTSLKYYKSSKKEKSLARLDLHRVGNIMMDPADASDCTFTIEVAGRQYYLCADTKERTMDWVITLNRVKEARMNIGGLKLLDPDFSMNKGATKGKVDKYYRNGSDSDEEDVHVPVSTRLVMNSMPSRARSKKIGKDDFSDMEKSIEEVESNVGGPTSLKLAATQSPTASRGTNSLASSPLHQQQNTIPNINSNAFLNPTQLNLLPPGVKDQVVVRWTKQRSAVQNWARRLSRWAKRMTMVRCVIQDDVVHLAKHQFTQKRKLADEGGANDSDSDGKEEPFIDLDIASYSQEPYLEKKHHSYEDVYNSKMKQPYDFVDHSANNSIQHSHSWKVQKNNDQVISSAGSSIQSSTGRISPAMIPHDDDGSGIT